ncbi:hypothetical protein SLA2020_184130 [Shorea laevis]
MPETVPIPRVTPIYPTLALPPSYSGAAMQRKKGKRNTTTTTPSPYVLSTNQQLKDDSDEDLQIISSGASPLLLNTKPKPKTTKARLKKTSRKLHKADSVSASASVCTTPALSTSSYTRYYNRHPPSNVGSWDATTTSFNDGDAEVDDPLDLPARQGCRIPCYWSKRPSKHKTLCRSCRSPSLSDTLRKGTSILGGTQSVYTGHRRSTSLSKKRLTHPLPNLFFHCLLVVAEAGEEVHPL